MIKKEKVIPIKYYLLCDNCGIEMRFIKKDSNIDVPETFIYQCQVCGSMTESVEWFPKINFINENKIQEELSNSGKRFFKKKE